MGEEVYGEFLVGKSLTDILKKMWSSYGRENVSGKE
jgi:hypothetical protein